MFILNLADVGDRAQADKVLERGLIHGTTRVFTVYSEIGVEELPQLVPLRKSLKDYDVVLKELGDKNFHRVNISYGSSSETVLLDTRLDDVWELTYVSSQPIQQSLASRFFSKLYPFLARIHLRSSYLTHLVDLLDQRYSQRPILTRVVAKQFFDIKKGETIIPKKTLVLYQEDCEPTLKFLQKNFTIWPSLLQMRVTEHDSLSYLAAFGRHGVSKFVAGNFKQFREDVFDFITKEAQRQRAEFEGRVPTLNDPELQLKPIVMEATGPVAALLPALRDGLLEQYHCAVIHDSNPYLDIKVVDSRSGSVFQVIGSGTTLAVIPVTYKTPVSLIKLTRTVSDIVGVEPAL